MEKEFNFTKRSIDALPIPGKGKRAIYRDKKTPGLGIRITGTGSKSFVVYRKMKGRPLMVTLGKYPQMTIEQARNEALDANQKINAGNNPNDEKRSIKDEETFGGLFQVYMDLHSKVHKRSWKDDQQRYDSYLSKWRNKKLSNIKSSDIQALHSKIGKESGIYAANRTLSLISSMFSKASDWGWKQGNPAKGIKKFKEQSRDRFLQADELPRFFKALANEPNTTIRDFFLVALLTGARRANVLAMRWDQISFEREEWKIPETKAGESHTLPLVAGVIDVLRQRKAEAKRKAEEEKTEGSPFVFPGHGKTGHLVEPKTAWKRILSRAALYGLIDQIAVSCEWDAQLLNCTQN
ncbi:MAG: site-specific integrase [Sedimenticola sp.]